MRGATEATVVGSHRGERGSRAVVLALVAGAALAGGLAVAVVRGSLRLHVQFPVAFAAAHGLAALALLLLAAAAWRHRRAHPDAFRGEGPALHVAVGAWAGGALASLLSAPLLLRAASSWDHVLLLPLHALTNPLSLGYLSLPLGNVFSLAGMLAGAGLGWLAWRRRRGAQAGRPTRASMALALAPAAGVSTAVLVAVDFLSPPISLGLDLLLWTGLGLLALVVGTVAGLCGLWRVSRRARGRRERVLAGGLLGGVLGYCAAAWLATGTHPDVFLPASAIAPLLVFLPIMDGPMTRAAWGPFLGFACVALGAWLGTRRGARADP